MEFIPLILTVVLIILAVVLIVVGVQVMLVLIEVKRTLQRINRVTDSAEQKINMIVQPLQNLGGMAGGLQAGMKVFEAFVSWLGRNKDNK